MGGLINPLLAITAFVPPFFFYVVWFLPQARWPRGLASALLLRRLADLRSP